VTIYHNIEQLASWDTGSGRPNELNNTLGNIIIEHGTLITLEKDSQIEPSKHNEVYYLYRGEVVLSHSDVDLILSIITENFVLGSIEGIRQNIRTKYVTLSTCTLYKMDFKEFTDIVVSMGLTWVFLELIAYFCEGFYTRFEIFSSRNNYEIVSTLISLFNEGRLKKKITLLKYLENRCLLSRSSIAAILAELKKGGFIDIEDGYLIRIKNKLPKKY
jgi:CRP-like cAMP-binding protein